MNSFSNNQPIGHNYTNYNGANNRCAPMRHNSSDRYVPQPQPVQPQPVQQPQFQTPQSKSPQTQQRQPLTPEKVHTAGDVSPPRSPPHTTQQTLDMPSAPQKANVRVPPPTSTTSRSQRVCRSIFNQDDDSFTSLMLSLTTPTSSDATSTIDSSQTHTPPHSPQQKQQHHHHQQGRRTPRRRNMSSRPNSLTNSPRSNHSTEPPLPEASTPWVIRTHTVEIIREQGDTLGMVIYSEKGKYGTRIDRAKPNSVSEKAGLRAEDIFVRLNGEVVLHCNHQQLVRKLVTMPLCFTAEVCESAQLPNIKGKYSIEVWREGCRRRTDDKGMDLLSKKAVKKSPSSENHSNRSCTGRRILNHSELSPTHGEDEDGGMILFSDSSDEDVDYNAETSRTAATLELDSW